MLSQIHRRESLRRLFAAGGVSLLGGTAWQAATSRPAAAAKAKDPAWDKSIERGLKWVSRTQSSAGHWTAQQFPTAMTALAGPKDRTLVLTCRSGARSARAAQVMEANGFADTVNVDGGWAGGAIAGWAQSGLPGSTQTGAGVGWDSVRATLGL